MHKNGKDCKLISIVTNTDTVSTDIVAILMHRPAVILGSVFESVLMGSRTQSGVFLVFFLDI